MKTARVEVSMEYEGKLAKTKVGIVCLLQRQRWVKFGALHRIRIRQL